MPAGGRKRVSSVAGAAGLCGWIWLTSGCTVPLRIQPAALMPAAMAKSPGVLGPGVFDWSDYDLWLRTAVTVGRVDYCCALDHSGALDRTLARLAQAGPALSPELFRTRSNVLAYWINAYNACIARSVLELVRGMIARGEIEALMAYVPSRDLDAGFEFTIDGALRTPAELRRRALEVAGSDWRVAFALCGGRAGDPPLFREAYLGDVIDHQLYETVRGAIEQPQIVTMDHGLQRLRVWKGFTPVRDRLVNDWMARNAAPTGALLNVLLEWASPSQRIVLNSAVGYRERTLAFDRRINQSPLGPEPKK